MVTSVVLIGVDQDEDGTYHVRTNQSYSIKMSFQETADLEMDMTNTVWFSLPQGIEADAEVGTIDVGVYDGYYKSILHNYSIADNRVTITWNQNSPYFEDLARAHYVDLTFNLGVNFDGTMDEVKFGDASNIVIKVDNTGSITVNKDITGLKSDVTMTDEQKSAMTFELLNAAGETVKTFTYADMESGHITYDGMAPGSYTVVETSHPNFTNYSFDTADSVVSKTDTLTPGGVLTLSLKNDYETDNGSLELNKTVNCTNWDGSTTVPSSVKNNISFTVTGPNGYNKTVKYSDFSNGKKVLTGLEVGEYTVTEKNNVTGYTWTYKVNGSAQDTASAKAQVTKNGTASASFENTYVQQTADLQVKKTATGADVPANTEFKVTFPDGTTTKTFTYSEMINGVYTLSKVPLGTYKVEEIHDTASVANYALTVSGEGKTTLTTVGKTVTIKNTYAPYGSLKVDKTIAGDLSSAVLTLEQKQAIKFEVYNAAQEKVATLTYADILSGKDTVSELPVGEYTIKETAPAISGYAVTATPSSKEVKVEVKVGQTATGSFTNTYTKDEYKITVNKVFGEDSFYTADNLPDDIKKETTFTISKGSTVVATCKYTELAEKLNGLLLSDAGPYTVTESNPTVSGVGISTKISVDGGQNYTNGTSAFVTVQNHTPATVTVCNTYTAQGMIKGDKTVVGLHSHEESELRKNVSFSIYSESNGTYTLYRENVTLAQLEAGIVVPVGNYYVQETGTLGVTGYDGPTIVTKVEDGETKDNSNTDNFAVAQNGTVTVHFTNKYTTGQGSGSVELIKYVRGLDEIGSAEETQLTNSLNVNNTKGTLLYDGISFKLEEKLNNTWYDFGTYTLDTLLHGGVRLRPGHYRMTELDGDVTDYSLHVDYVIKSASTTVSEQKNLKTVEFDITTGQSLNVEAHNVYTKLGNLKITKKITGDLTSLNGTQRKNIKFEVTGPFDFKETFTYNDIRSNGIKTFTNIPVGEYTVKETAGTITDYTHSVTVSGVSDGGKVTVPVGETAQVDFTNTYTRQVGSLKIRKILTGEVPETLTAEQKQAMRFSVRDSSNKEVYAVTFDEFDAGEYTFPNVPTGKYTVVETIGNQLTNSYTITIDKNNQSVTVANGNTATITITNTFTKTGTLTLRKTFDGAQIPDAKKATVQFRYWRIDESGNKIGDETTVSYADFTNGVYTVQNLTPGRYTVVELDDTTGYQRTTTVSVNDAEPTTATSANTDVVFDTTSTVAFKNTYTEIASLKITKAIAGDLNASNLTDTQKKAIVFTVKDSSGNPVVDSFSLFDMAGSSKVIGNLTPGNYTVEETVNDPDETLFGEYTCAAKYQIGTASAMSGTVAEVTAVHGENTVAFTNTFKKIAPLNVVKSSSKTYVGLAEIDGMKYPVWRFTLAISNLNPLTTRNGTTTFTDVFDATWAEWFRLATSQEVAAALDTDTAQNVCMTSLVTGKEAPSAAFADNERSIVISGITNDTADKCDFTYYLIVKDRDALNAINTPASEGLGGVSLSFNNKVTYHPLPNKTDTATTDADYVYKFTAVEKGITNLDIDGNLYDIIDGQKVLVNYADYSVVLNKEGVTIGDQPTIIATDTFSDNQTVLISSIKTDPAEGVSYKLDNNEHTLEFTIPNGTPVAISYRVNIVDGQNATVQLQNSIELLGFIDSINQEAHRSVGGSGQGRVYSATLIKVDALNNNIKLNGVKFVLYDGADDERLTTCTTNAQGQVLIKYWGDTGSFKPDHNYYLKEESTASGYNLDSGKIWLRISDDETPGIDADGVHVLPNGGELIVENEPVSVALEVTKSFNNWSKQSAFSFKLEAVDNAPMPAAGGDVAVTTQDNPATDKNESTGVFGIIRFNVSDADFENDHVVTYRYTIQEIVNPDDMVAGITYDTVKHPVTVVISDRDHDGNREVAVTYDENQSNLTVVNKYAEGSLTISKTLSGNDTDSTKDFTFTIKLNTALSGTYSDVVFTNGEATITLKGGESKTIEGLPNGTGYTVTEADYSADGYENSNPNGYTGTIDENTPAVAAFTNTRNTYGNLTVTKTVDGNAGSTTKEFSFTVTLKDTSISGTYGDMTFVNGVATFTLTDGGSKTAEGLPNGVIYTVVEADYTNDGYVTTKRGDEGTIVGDDTLTAAFTNTKNTTPPTPPTDPEVGNLTVSKTISGNAADSTKEFSFTVTLGDTTINGTYGAMSFTNGVATFTLKGGESKTATGLPAGTSYTVAEADYSTDGYVTTKSGDTGTITDGQTATAAFTNTKNTTPPTPPVDPKFGNLTISKNVTGDLGDKTKYFTFKVEFNVDGTFSYIGSKTGTITNGGTIQLKHGESITIVDIPAGTSYTVTESGNSGYSVYASGDTGIISDGKTSTAKFTNTRSSVPKTGDHSNMPLWFSLMGISVLGMIGTLFIKTNKRRKAAHLRNK